MKNRSTIVLSGTIIAIAAISLLGFNTLSATPFLVAESVKDPTAGASMLGHVTYIVRDKDGNVKNYFQGDNTVTQRGHNCAVQMLFSNSTAVTGGTGCSSISATRNALFSYIAIGNGTTGISATGADTTLPTGGTNPGEVTPRIAGTVTLNQIANNQATATIATAAPFSFTQLGAGGTTIHNSGLFNRQSTCGVGGCSQAAALGDLFADKDISVTVAPSDTLSVTWTITIG